MRIRQPPKEDDKGRAARGRRSVYEDLDPNIYVDDTDPDQVEPGWDRVGELDPHTGAWISGRPRWPTAPPPGAIWWR